MSTELKGFWNNQEGTLATFQNPTRAYDEIIEFIASGTSPQGVIDFKPSELVKKRVSDLIYREKSEDLTHDEKIELEHYIQIEHLMRLAKARARQYVDTK